MTLAALLTLFLLPAASWAQDTTETTTPPATETEEAPVTEETTAAPIERTIDYSINSIMLLVCGALVFFMQAGFAMVESGFNASKNAVNILFKNSMDICIGVLIFFAVGFGLMYPGAYGVDVAENSVVAFGDVGLDTYVESPAQGYSKYADWFFQAMFAGTAATIVSGAVAGRMRIGGYLLYSAFISALIYPISGFWKWGSGWLTQFDNGMVFQDFAGSAVVHAVGGFAGLAGAIVLGPRLGRYVDGKSVPMPGHNLPLAALGVFILWFGWYGFNCGSVLAFTSGESVDAFTSVAVTTTLAAGAGGIVATLVSWLMFGKPDLSMGLNGILAGLVSITACADCMSPMWSMVIGAIGGVLVIAGILLLDKLQIDDPVGAWPVHGLCGIWGCLAIGIIPNSHAGASPPKTDFMTQLIGTGSICLWSFVTMFIFFSLLKMIGILRVSPEEEQSGLDMSEHGMKAYTH
jgi:Amt family ammonium transporter